MHLTFVLHGSLCTHFAEQNGHFINERLESHYSLTETELIKLKFSRITPRQPRTIIIYRMCVYITSVYLLAIDSRHDIMWVK